jgi:hypothetical protein
VYGLDLEGFSFLNKKDGFSSSIIDAGLDEWVGSGFGGTTSILLSSHVIFSWKLLLMKWLCSLRFFFLRVKVSGKLSCIFIWVLATCGSKLVCILACYPAGIPLIPKCNLVTGIKFYWDHLHIVILSIVIINSYE